MASIKVLVWGENLHEWKNETVRGHYPDGMHHHIAGWLNRDPSIRAETATLQDPEHGLPPSRLEETDVLVWWGHMAHEAVDDGVAERVVEQVNAGMGFLPLHSAHFAKPFKRLMGTTCTLSWRDRGERERLWICNPAHPIVEGIEGPYIEIPRAEMYSEPFQVPAPDEQIFVSWFAGGEVFRSGNVWYRGAGKVFYFRPGHETFPIYHDPAVMRVIGNACKWLAPRRRWNHITACPPVAAPEDSGTGQG